jgi:hypothetical protein
MEVIFLSATRTTPSLHLEPMINVIDGVDVMTYFQKKDNDTAGGATKTVSLKMYKELSTDSSSMKDKVAGEYSTYSSMLNELT